VLDDDGIADRDCVGRQVLLDLPDGRVRVRFEQEDRMHHRYEGMVAKDPQSPYVAERTLKWLKGWLKVKQTECRVKERGFYDPDR